MTTASEHRPWAELDPVTQAALRCKDPRFRAFLKETYPRDYQDIWDQEEAAHTVRAICEIESRRELASNANAQATWHALDTLYQAWLARER